MAHTALDPAFRRLVDEHAPVHQAGSGFTFTEGPIWHPTEHYLLFSERRRLDRAGVREVARPSNKANGLTYDAELNLIACEHATSSLVRIRPDGAREVLASHYQGRELNSPNDVCVASDGAIYFTDACRITVWSGRGNSAGRGCSAFARMPGRARSRFSLSSATRTASRTGCASRPTNG